MFWTVLNSENQSLQTKAGKKLQVLDFSIRT